MSKTILLFGATGDTGREILDQALAAGHKVRGAEREWPENFCDHPNFERREADLLDDDLSHLMDGIDCVISAVGLGRDPRTLINPPPLYTQGAVNIVRGMRTAGVGRLVVISAAFADPAASVPTWFRAATAPLDRIFRQMADMERVLALCEDIEWTAVRPGWLLDRPHTGDYATALNDLPEGTLRTRHGDLADFMLACATHGQFIRETPFIARKEGSALELPPALVEEFLPF